MARSFSNVSKNLAYVRHEISEAVAKYGRDPGDVRLMAVTKTVPANLINEVIGLGVDLLGENKAQELLAKYDDLDRENVSIHFIGHLQTNKVRQVIEKVGMIHSVDRAGLAKEIDAQSRKSGKVMDVLIEVNIGGESSKSGVNPEALTELLEEISVYSHIKVKGLMTIPPICGEILQIERYFCAMRQLFIDMRAKKMDNVHMDILSMGMSGDFVPAIKHGANIIRIGAGIFGERDYT